MGFWVLEGTTPRFKAPYLYLKGIFGSWKVQRFLLKPPTFIVMGFWVLEDTTLPFKAPYLYSNGNLGPGRYNISF